MARIHRPETSVHPRMQLRQQGDRSLAFSIVGLRLNSFAVWLHDGRKEKTLANALFRFPESEARLTDSPTYKVISRNASIGP